MASETVMSDLGTRTRTSPRESRRVLIVDDSPVARATLRSMLRTDDAIDWEVAESEDARGLFERLDSLPPFDVLVLDVQMPGMNGLAACEVLRATNQSLPVLFLTGEGHPASYAMARSAGGDCYLLKPFSASSLRAALRTLLSLRRRPAAHG